MLLNDKLIIDDIAIENGLNSLYNSFESGFKFEDFLRPFLMDVMRLDNVRVTKKTGDGGIDLVATNLVLKDMISDDSLNDEKDNIVSYKVQAKCWKPTRSVPPKEINQLRGTMIAGDRGLFIATCSYTKNAISIAKDEIRQREHPMFLLDGKLLIKMCMLNAFGFKYIPTIDKEQIDKFTNSINNDLSFSLDEELRLGIVNKKITNNDVRARIIRLPLEIKNKLDLSSKKVKVRINDSVNTELTLDATKSYLAGVTDIYRKNGLLLDSGETKSANTKMFVEGDMLNIIINCE